MEELFMCEYCGEELTTASVYNFDGVDMCRDCYREKVAVCNHCGDSVWAENTVSDNNCTLCQSCYDRHYTNCDNCDAIIHYDNAYYHDNDDYPYCRECYENNICNASIKDYNYKPDPIFYGDGQPHYGIELEIDEGGEDRDNADKLLCIANTTDEHIYIKHDGSLEEGMEIVSHPMTLDYHTNKMNWRDVLQKSILMGYLSHQAETCGLHIHVSRSALGDSIEEQENTIGRILYFYEKFWAEILRFSRRTEYQVSRWASRYGGALINPKESLATAKKACFGRYVAVNLQNQFTVEFRIFRGTLKYLTFIATLQFADELVRLARVMPDESFQTMSWSDFVLGIDLSKNELIEYLKNRRLYVNEPVAECEEI